MTRIHTVIIGGGQAGLAMSRCLVDCGIDHVVLERGRVAERWRSERWESLKLLTPNWQTRLPGFKYDGPDPNGFMGMPELIRFFDRYAGSFDAPIETGATVRSVRSAGRRFRVRTEDREWCADNVVVATGYNDVPYVPPLATRLSRDVIQVVPTHYRKPDDLPEGEVLVVGASATGVQLAEEIHASGRPVTLAVGRHLRLPRIYRGRDILWWLDAMGVFGESVESMFDLRISRRQPSLQLVGRRDRPSLDIGYLHRQGVRLAGRVVDASGDRVTCDDEVIANAAAADVKLVQLLTRIDAFIHRAGLDHEAGEAPPFKPTWPAAWHTAERTVLPRIRTVVWATGFRRRYPWLQVPVLDEQGDIPHRGGVTPHPGLYVLGMHLQRRRNSAFIDGVGEDAEVLAERIVCRAAVERAAAIRARREEPWPAISLT
jgi:putative flavoprotein involved in K+ transport